MKRIETGRSNNGEGQDYNESNRLMAAAQQKSNERMARVEAQEAENEKKRAEIEGRLNVERRKAGEIGAKLYGEDVLFAAFVVAVATEATVDSDEKLDKKKIEEMLKENSLNFCAIPMLSGLQAKLEELGR